MFSIWHLILSISFPPITLVCFVFGWVGYLFACCFMVTVAASTGSAAGFGLYLVHTAVLFNVSSLGGQCAQGGGRGL